MMLSEITTVIAHKLCKIFLVERWRRASRTGKGGDGWKWGMGMKHEKLLKGEQDIVEENKKREKGELMCCLKLRG